MGNSQSNFKIYYKLNHVMPGVHDHGFGDGKIFDKSIKPYSSSNDREQFIYATITVISQNGLINLRDHDFRLLYSRRDDDRIVARIVAEKEGVIKAQITPAKGGATQGEAFMALRKHVEIQLDHILNDLPGSSSDKPYLDHEERNQAAGLTKSTTTTSVGPSSPASPGQGTRPAALEPQSLAGQGAPHSDAPPAYGKAVKEWQTDEKRR